MTADELRELFPNASEQFIRANADAGHQHPAPTAKPERSPGNGALAAPQAETRHPGKYVVRVTSHRVRLLDSDNLVPKWHVDALRYAGCLPSDAPDRADIITTQKKVRTKEEERTEIVIERMT